MLRCRIFPFNHPLSPSFLSLKVMASGPLGKTPSASRPKPLIIFGAFNHDPPN
jgi:hypothetical protein